ncbi:MAG: AmmeMemoRadiSam system protein B [Sphaerochaeta sp.]
MLESHHHMIFYPENRHELDLATAPRKTRPALHSLPAAILVPHASYKFSLEALHRGFASVAALNPSLVVFLAPLHQEVLQEDDPAFLFSSSSEGIEIAGKKHLFAVSLQEKLAAKHTGVLALQDSYLEEESALELTLPLIDSYFPSVPVLPILSGACTSDQARDYGKILADIRIQEPRVLFVISANANALLPSPQAEEDANAFIERLQSGQSFLEKRGKARISSCNSASLEALRQLSLFHGSWVITGRFDSQGEHTTMDPRTETKEKHVWHISAYIGDTNA